MATQKVRTGQVTTPVVDSTSTGATNNWALALGSGDALVTWHGASDIAVTGIAGGVAGQLVTIKNTGTKIATFAHNSGSSSAGNKLFNFATSAPTPVAAGGFITYQHDGTQWQIVDHEQGAWITPPFSAGDFTASGSMTWTVEAGDVTALRYYLSGRKLAFIVTLETTTVGGTLSEGLFIAIPYTATVLKWSLETWGWDNNVKTQIRGSVSAGIAALLLYRYDGANWSASTNLTYIYGGFTIEVD